MLSYRLDDLGWYHFERLIQSVLKAVFGIWVESWGGLADEGKDAYCEGPLLKTVAGIGQEGPVIFQVKFVEGAGAAGSQPGNAIKKAAASERVRILERQARTKWKGPRDYVFITNAAMGGSLRSTVTDYLQPVLAGSRIHILDGKDVCGLLDSNRQIVRSFPELLSLKDIEHLLAETVNREIIERSRAALDLCKDVLKVFVHTAAYSRALDMLAKRNVLLISGPPEMGKTTIAKMISLLQVIEGWQVVDCRDPSDFFGCFDKDADQIFVIDDAFGRTEYDISSGREWERDLEKVLIRADCRHWVILTARTLILKRALDSMDLTGVARSFPKPWELVVNAEELTQNEKARILYRHARLLPKGDRVRLLVREHALAIVESPFFTPERIRLLIVEPPVELADNSGLSLREIIEQAIRNPTKRMRSAFSSLPELHRRILFSLLSVERRSSSLTLIQRSITIYKIAEADQLPGAIFDLDDHFLRVRETADSVDWIHPSYRELVVDELAKRQRDLIPFLRMANYPAAQLALTGTGAEHRDSSSSRPLALMPTEESWDCLGEALVKLAQDGFQARQILSLLCASIKNDGLPRSQRRRILKFVPDVLAQAEETWIGSADTLELETYTEACRIAGCAPKLSVFIAAQKLCSHKLRAIVSLSKFNQDTVDSWFSLVYISKAELPSILAQPAQRDSFRSDLLFVSRLFTLFLNSWEVSPERLALYAASVANWANLLPTLPFTSRADGDRFIEISRRLRECADRLFQEEEYYSQARDDERWEDYEEDGGPSLFDLFSDL